MGQDPEAIREQIEQTRDEMSGTVEALGHKADVKGRAKSAISEKTDSLKSKVTGVTGSVSDSTPDGQQVKDGAKQAVGVAQENPIGLAVGGIAAGFLLGMMIPTTRIENEKLGELSDQVKDQVKETGQEALERGKEVAQKTAAAAGEAASETVKETGQQQAQEMKDSVQGTESEPATPQTVQTPS
jgi:hypothetical protein